MKKVIMLFFGFMVLVSPLYGQYKISFKNGTSMECFSYKEGKNSVVVNNNGKKYILRRDSIKSIEKIQSKVKNVKVSSLNNKQPTLNELSKKSKKVKSEKYIKNHDIGEASITVVTSGKKSKKSLQKQEKKVVSKTREYIDIKNLKKKVFLNGLRFQNDKYGGASISGRIVNGSQIDLCGVVVTLNAVNSKPLTVFASSISKNSSFSFKEYVYDGGRVHAVYSISDVICRPCGM